MWVYKNECTKNRCSLVVCSRSLTPRCLCKFSPPNVLPLWRKCECLFVFLCCVCLQFCVFVCQRGRCHLDDSPEWHRFVSIRTMHFNEPYLTPLYHLSPLYLSNYLLVILFLLWVLHWESNLRKCRGRLCFGLFKTFFSIICSSWPSSWSSTGGLFFWCRWQVSFQSEG